MHPSPGPISENACLLGGVAVPSARGDRHLTRTQSWSLPCDSRPTAMEGSPMNKSTKRLGRGLSALISVPEAPATAAEMATQEPAPPAAAIMLDISTVRPNPFQPRREIAP